ncbi:MAG: PIN domain-containing protein [Actinomycetota bacterium]
MIIADTSGLLALFNSSEPEHAAVRDHVAEVSERLVVSPYVVAGLDYLVASACRCGCRAGRARGTPAGAYELAKLDAADIERASAVIRRYRDQSIGLADASIVVLAERHRTRQILTLDRRHFDMLRPLSGGRFKLIP